MTTAIAFPTKDATIIFHNTSQASSKKDAKGVVQKIVEQAETNHGFICISGYESETGMVRNYVLQPYGPNAYQRLLEDSLQMLERQELDLPSTLNGQTIPQSVWTEAILEQIVSFRKSLDGGHGRVDNRVKINKAFYELDGTVYVANVRIVKVHETPEQARHNDAYRTAAEEKNIPKSSKAKAKKYLRDNTPVGNFRGQFKLDIDKFERIAFSGTVIEFADFGELFTP